MCEDDRRKLFWYVKRKTSYTAWKAKADAFDCFAAVFEQQVREEPLAARPGARPGSGTNWEWSFPEILKAQVLHEQGLGRLLQGDRTVWLYNDRGVFGDADAIYGYWYMALVAHGPHGDIFFRGKYVDDLTAAILDVVPYAYATAGVMQQVWENPVYYDFWSKEHMAHLEREVRFPPNLPDVPIPTKAVLVHTGDPAPCFGIYEAREGWGKLHASRHLALDLGRRPLSRRHHAGRRKGLFPDDGKGHCTGSASHCHSRPCH
jgi:hypothetical protein